MLKIIRHGFFTFYLGLTAFTFLLGGGWLWFGYLCLSISAISLDLLLTKDKESHSDSSKSLMNFYLFMNVPLLYLNLLAFNWQLSPEDFLSIGAIVKDAFGYNLMAEKMELTLVNKVGAYFSLAILVGASGTVTAHELVHRVWDKKSLIAGRLLLAPSCDTSFSIEHVYGHHAHVATPADPATSRRGENFWAFFPRSTFGQYKSAWQIEKKRLLKRYKCSPWSHRNIFLRGQIMSLAVASLFVSAQGWLVGGLSFALIAIFAKLYLEAINFVEHYGLLRREGEGVMPHHSWNCNERFSLYCLYNLPRHSHHHEKGHVPFWDLKPYPDAPTLPLGYMGMIAVAMVPPLHKRIMKPLLQQWDEKEAEIHRVSGDL